MKRSQVEKYLLLLRAEFLVKAPILPLAEWVLLERLGRAEIPTAHTRISRAPKDTLPQRVLRCLKLA